MEIVETISLTMGVAWASGINLYAAIFMLGFMGSAGYIELPPDLQILSDPLVLVAAGFMYCVEFFTDKTPGVDTGWDAIHTFIRIPAGALLAAGAVGDVSPALTLTVGILGGTLAAGAHVTKAGSRVLINTSPEPFSNWAASITEDVAVIAGLWTALHYPWVFLILIVAFILLMIWLLPKLFRAIKRGFQTVKRWFSGKPEEAPSPNVGSGDAVALAHDASPPMEHVPPTEKRDGPGSGTD